jgi:hypothetical protein
MTQTLPNRWTSPDGGGEQAVDAGHQRRERLPQPGLTTPGWLGA